MPTTTTARSDARRRIRQLAGCVVLVAMLVFAGTHAASPPIDGWTSAEGYNS